MHNILIIPDVHGRTNWKHAIKDAVFDRVVFLGDYLDPYYYFEDISYSDAFDNFKEIVEYRKSNPDNTVLLLGNHDCTYLYGKNVCYDRCDDEHFGEIQDFFRNNRNLFLMAWEITLKNKRYIFTHAGISSGWMDRFAHGWSSSNAVDVLNRLNIEALECRCPEKTRFARALAIRGRYRSSIEDYASPVWMDAELLHELPVPGDFVQIVGHTQRIGISPVFTPSAIYTDCGGKVFLLDDSGTIRDIEGKVCENGCDDPFNPPQGRYENCSIGFDCFSRPFCRKCGSRNIYVRGGTMVDSYSCNDCGTYAYM